MHDGLPIRVLSQMVWHVIRNRNGIHVTCENNAGITPGIGFCADRIVITLHHKIDCCMFPNCVERGFDGISNILFIMGR